MSGPAWVVWGDMGEGFGDPVGASSDETEPDVTFPAFGSERRSRGGIGPDPYRVNHRCGVVTRRMPHPHPLRQRPDSRVQHVCQIRNLIRSGVTPPQPSSERLPRPVREAIHWMEPVLVVISRRGARFCSPSAAHEPTNRYPAPPSPLRESQPTPAPGPWPSPRPGTPPTPHQLR